MDIICDLFFLIPLTSKVFELQSSGCAQNAGNFKGFPDLIKFLHFEVANVFQKCTQPNVELEHD